MRSLIILALTFVAWAAPRSIAAAQQPTKALTWSSALRQNAAWFSSPEATRIADNLLLYQRSSGGWPKNIDMAVVLSDSDRTKLNTEKQSNDSTIDNSSTYTQLNFLARVYTAQHLARHRDAFFTGLDYLFKAQYENGGWPQFYPDLSGYYKHITYNDDAMIGVLKLLRDIAVPSPEYSFVDEARRAKAARAVERGIDCILKTQIIVDGKRTVWCAQYDEVTLAPAAARKYELVSLSGGESAGIVRFLMSIDRPSPEVVASIKAAIAWFEKSKLMGIKWVTKPDATKMHGFDRVVVQDSNAGPLWARFYDIQTNRPIFVGRDSVVHYDVAEIEDERRNGYSWYVDTAAELLSKEYPSWLAKRK
ncbi:MAG TPA: pectate lyase [Pyrinomonadaceae bacterium]